MSLDRLKEALTDLEEVKVALEASGEWDENDTDAVALEVLRMMAAGQHLWWCEVHKAERSSRNKCLTWYRLKALKYEPISTCRIVEGWWMPTGKDET